MTEASNTFMKTPEDFLDGQEAFYREVFRDGPPLSGVPIAALVVDEVETVIPAEVAHAMGLGSADAVARYTVVDLRGVLPGSALAANAGEQAKTDPPIVHFNGAPSGYVGVASGRMRPADAWYGDAEYHRAKNWGTPQRPARANGIQYHRGAWGTTIYILRNPKSILWHCGNQRYNASSAALQIPVSFKERITEETIRTAAAWVSDQNIAQGDDPTRGMGHKEVGDSKCPGTDIMERLVLPLRAGRLKSPGGTPVKPPTKPPSAGPAKPPVEPNIFRVVLASDLRAGTQLYASGTRAGAEEKAKYLKSWHGITAKVEESP